jgi:hypothetical protein
MYYANKVTIKHFIPVPITLFYTVPVLFMPNSQSFGCVFALILALFRRPGSGSAFGMRIRIRNTVTGM